MKGMIQEFKEFAVKGNMIDIAVGVVIGAAFNKVIDSLVKDVFMPILGILTGGIDFSYLKYNLTTDSSIRYGLLIQNLIDFLIIALTVFVVIKIMNRLRNKAQDTEDTTVSTPKEIELLSELKKLMEEQNKLLKKS